jgi:hypothetical protein
LQRLNPDKILAYRPQKNTPIRVEALFLLILILFIFWLIDFELSARTFFLNKPGENPVYRTASIYGKIYPWKGKEEK